MTSKGWGVRFPFKEVAEVQGVGKGKRGVRLEKKELVIGITVGDTIVVETARGGERKVKCKDLEVGEFGGEGERITDRIGFRKVVTQAPDLYEWPEEE